MDASIIALRRKITVLNNCGRFNEIPEVGQTIIDLLADFEQHPDEFHDGTYREPPEALKAIVDAPRTPQASLSPQQDLIAFTGVPGLPGATRARLSRAPSALRASRVAAQQTAEA